MCFALSPLTFESAVEVVNFTNIYYLQEAQQRDSAPRRRVFSVQTETASICPGVAAPENRCLEGITEVAGEEEEEEKEKVEEEEEEEESHKQAAGPLRPRCSVMM